MLLYERQPASDCICLLLGRGYTVAFFRFVSENEAVGAEGGNQNNENEQTILSNVLEIFVKASGSSDS